MTAKLDYGFAMTQTQDGKLTRFGVYGSGIGGGAWFAFIFGGLFFGGLMAIIFGMSGFVLVMIALIGSALLWDFSRKKRYEFEITDAIVRAPNGVEYAKSDISEILIRNQNGVAYSAPAHSSTFVVGTGSAGVALAGAIGLSNSAKQVGNALGEAVAQSLSKNGNEVCVRHGRKVIVLARHLKEDDAISLFNKIKELL